LIVGTGSRLRLAAVGFGGAAALGELRQRFARHARAVLLVGVQKRVGEQARDDFVAGAGGVRQVLIDEARARAEPARHGAFAAHRFVGVEERAAVAPRHLALGVGEYLGDLA